MITLIKGSTLDFHKIPSWLKLYLFRQVEWEWGCILKQVPVLKTEFYNIFHITDKPWEYGQEIQTVKSVTFELNGNLVITTFH